MAIIPKGKEPASIKKRLDILFPKLNQAYPDKKISGLYKEHKKWAETVTELYWALGYPDGTSFLEAYGYTVVINKGGRHTTIDPDIVILNLMEKYPDGSGFTSITQLIEADEEFAAVHKTLANNSMQYFGMPLGKYLTEQGILSPKKPMKKTKQDISLYKICIAGTNAEVYYSSVRKNSLKENDYVFVPFGMRNKNLIGKVKEIITCSEDEIPCNIKIKKQVTEIYFSPHTQSDEFLKNIIRADSAVRTETLISKLSVTDFTPAAKSEVTAENIIWACCKGLSDEIVNVTGYLINNNNYTYGYNDIIVSEDGISEIFVYSDDVNKVIKKFPNIKVAAFSYDENSGKISVCYSESGYPMLTDKYETGCCDIKDKSAWVLQHKPYEDLIIDGITYKFRNKSDWDELNYVFENSDGKSNQLRKG